MREKQVSGGPVTRPFQEELANSATHGAGLVLSVTGTAAIVGAPRFVESGLSVACGAYTASLVVVYALSTLSHAVPWPRSKHLFRVWDQGTIYLLIAGTYTPFMWYFVTSPLRWISLAVLWAAALAGLYSKVVTGHRIHAVSTDTYLALGLLPALVLMNFVPPACLAWIAVGGLMYVVGTLFLQMDERYRYFHATWHVFVIMGSASHFYAIFTFVVQPSVMG